MTRPEEVGKADDGELVQALEDKYDALRDKLIADALMKQVGEAEWKNMSERDRMAKLVQLKLEAKRLKKEGRFYIVLVRENSKAGLPVSPQRIGGSSYLV